MRFALRTLAAGLCFSVIGCTHADLVLRNGKIVTLEEDYRTPTSRQGIRLAYLPGGPGSRCPGIPFCWVLFRG